MINNAQELLNSIEREFIQLRYRWKLFSQLYDSGQEKVDLLNKSGSNVFQLLQKLIIDDVMMCLCRLSDRDKSMGNENASIRNLFKKVQGSLSSEVSNDIDAKLLELDMHMKNISLLRKKALAHTDLTHALKAELLPRPTYDELESSIEVIKAVLNKLTDELFNFSSNYDPLMPIGSDGDKLLRVLHIAHQHGN